ncbi:MULTISPECIES: DUF305 domain-containing protein [Janibacter]|uniref:DUF305 domain-containing protein n=1 Tax=Janibacter indicus TaxID=857417 RepID=A0A1W1YHV3_9MICO|nr:MULTISPECIES: DUF305 domain-containing protein [Janibacter]QNF94109.1 DUF305 domain-containing protein [Janibacter sp. YB324]QOK22708.1 DUF305 domain-containing protein [Janibacter indicus]SMC35810.1 Uncharacterized conserved protein, DUF305 family [Janibacter indicus]
MTPRVVLAAVVALAIGLVAGLALSRVGGDDLPGDDSVAAGFARDMQTHHDQAVEMSWIIYDRTDDSLVRSLAYDIARTQESQSGQMAGWLQVWGLSPTGPGKQMDWMRGLGHEHGATMTLGDDGLMPGMATQAEMTKLKGMRGKAADIYYLQMMIRHHKAGVPMAEAARDNSQNDAVETLAQSIINSQTTEVETMTQMLKERGAKPLAD